MIKPTMWRFSRKRVGYPLDKLEVGLFDLKLTSSEALQWFQEEVDKYGLDDFPPE